MIDARLSQALCGCNALIYTIVLLMLWRWNIATGLLRALVVCRIILPYQCYMPCMYNAAVVSFVSKPSLVAIRLDVEERIYDLCGLIIAFTALPLTGSTVHSSPFGAISHTLRPYLTCPPIYPRAGRTPGSSVIQSQFGSLECSCGLSCRK